MVFEENIICFGHMKHMKKKPNSQEECGVGERGGIIVCGRWTRSARPRGLGGLEPCARCAGKSMAEIGNRKERLRDYARFPDDFEFTALKGRSRVSTLHPELYKNLREGARRVIGATAKPLYPIDGKAGGLDRRSPQTSLIEGGGPPAGGGRSPQTAE